MGTKCHTVLLYWSAELAVRLTIFCDTRMSLSTLQEASYHSPATLHSLRGWPPPKGHAMSYSYAFSPEAGRKLPVAPAMAIHNSCCRPATPLHFECLCCQSCAAQPDTATHEVKICCNAARKPGGSCAMARRWLCAQMRSTSRLRQRYLLMSARAG